MKRRTRWILLASSAAISAAALAAARRASLERVFRRELAASGLSAGDPGPAVTEADVAALPEPAQRFMRFARVVGRPRDATFAAHFRGRFRPKRQGGWFAAEMRQFNAAPVPTRIFHMTLRMWGVPVYGRDVYVGGRGSMVVRPLDLFTVEDARGPEFDVGELVTWLNDAVLIAPSMLLAPGVRFSAADGDSFDVAVTDGATTARARVFVDGGGAPTRFETTDRFLDRVRTRWTTPVDGWQEVDGRMLATGGRATWHLADGEYSYAEIRIRPGDVVFNVAPDAMPVRPATPPGG